MTLSTRHATDEALAARAQGGEDAAADELVRRYWGIAWHVARSYYMPGSEFDDVLSVALVGLAKAIRLYRPGMGAAFDSYAGLSIKRACLTGVKSATGAQNRLLVNARRIEEDCDRLDDGEHRKHLGFVESFEERLLSQLSARQELARARDLLSDREWAVMTLRARGMTYDEIAAEIGATWKSIDNTLHRVTQRKSAMIREAMCA